MSARKMTTKTNNNNNHQTCFYFILLFHVNTLAPNDKWIRLISHIAMLWLAGQFRTSIKVFFFYYPVHCAMFTGGRSIVSSVHGRQTQCYFQFRLEFFNFITFDTFYAAFAMKFTRYSTPSVDKSTK